MPTVLVIDDEPAIRTLVTAVLEGARIGAIQAADGAQGLELARRQRPDLILLDILMPRLNGIDVCRRIRATAELATTPVVMLTACGQESDIERSYAAGADGFIIKPFRTATLLDTITRALSAERAPLAAS